MNGPILKAYQIETAERIARMMLDADERKHGALMAWDMGMGKTATAIEIAKRVQSQMTLFLVPASLMSTCRKELQLWYPEACVLPDNSFVPSSAATAAAADAAATICIVSHTKLSSMMSAYGHSLSINDVYTSEWLQKCIMLCQQKRTHFNLNEDTIKRVLDKFKKDEDHAPSELQINEARVFFELTPWDLVVLDEAHAFKNGNALCTKGAAFLKSKYRLALTGTAVRNSWKDMPNIVRYALHYGPADVGDTWERTNSDLYRQILFYRKEEQDDQEEEEEEERRVRPRRTLHHQDVHVDMLTQDCSVYMRQLSIVADTAANFGAEENARLRFFNEADMLSVICYHPDMFLRRIQQQLPKSKVASVTPSPKMLAIAQIIQRHREDEKVIVMSRSLVFLRDYVMPFLRKQHSCYCVLLSGNAKKDEVIQKFSESKRPRTVLCATIGVAGQGINLQHASGIMILCEPGWNPSIDRQAIGRINRMGQPRSDIYVYRLLAANSIDTAFVEMQHSKEVQAQAAYKLQDCSDMVSSRLKASLDMNPATALRSPDKIGKVIPCALYEKHITQGEEGDDSSCVVIKDQEEEEEEEYSYDAEIQRRFLAFIKRYPMQRDEEDEEMVVVLPEKRQKIE